MDPEDGLGEDRSHGALDDFGAFLAASTKGMVSVTTRRFNGESVTRCTAGPESTAWVQQARDVPGAILEITPEASLKVPPVSMMSSMMTTSFPMTSPMRFMALALPGASRRLSIRPRVAVQALGVGPGPGHPAGIRAKRWPGRSENFPGCRES